MNKTSQENASVKHIDCSGEFSTNKILQELSLGDSLLDFKNTKFSLVKFEHLNTFAKKLSEDQNLIGARIALYCPSELQIGIGRVMQTLVKNRETRLQLRCFRNSFHARNWLNE